MKLRYATPAIVLLLTVASALAYTSLLINGTKFNSSTPTIFTLSKPVKPNWEVDIAPNLQYNLSTSKIYIDLLYNPKNDLTATLNGAYNSPTGYSRIRIKISAEGSVPIIYYLTNSSENNEVILYQSTANVLGGGSTTEISPQRTLKVFWIEDKLTISVFDGNKETARLVNGLTLGQGWTITHVGVWSDETPTPVKAGYVQVSFGTPTATFVATDFLYALIPLIVLVAAIAAVTKMLNKV
jgi:hypothetical protein